jgi:hypothetical protein
MRLIIFILCFLGSGTSLVAQTTKVILVFSFFFLVGRLRIPLAPYKFGPYFSRDDEYIPPLSQQVITNHPGPRSLFTPSNQSQGSGPLFIASNQSQLADTVSRNTNTSPLSQRIFTSQSSVPLSSRFI